MSWGRAVGIRYGGTVYKWDKIRNQVGEARGEDAKGSIWGPEMSKGAVEIHPGCSQRRVFLLVIL